MEKNERGSALVSSLPYAVLSHTLTVMVADGYAVEFTLPGSPPVLVARKSHLHAGKD